MDNEKINQWCARSGINIIIKYKWIFIILIIVFLLVGYTGMQGLVTDSSNESFLPENDETVVRNDRFKEIFGNEEFVFIFIEAEDVFDHGVLTYIRTLSEDLDKNLPFVKEVVSLTDIEYVETSGDDLKIDELIGENIPVDEKTLRQIEQKVMSKKIYVDRIISGDGKKTGIAVSFERIPEFVYIPYRRNFSALGQVDGPGEQVIMRKDIFTGKEVSQQENRRFLEVRDPRKLIGPALKVILARHKTDRYKVIATGVPVLDFEAERIISKEGQKFGLVALVVSIILLFVIFRSFTAVIAPFLVLISTLIILYGAMGLLGIPITMTSMIITPLILVISVSYSIHVINHFQHHFRKTGNRKEAVRYTFRHSTWPCFLTAVTTAIGFASFMVVPIKPIREMGIACSAGVFITYFLVIIVVPIFFSIGKDKLIREKNPPLKSKKDNPGINAFFTRWADFVIGNSKIVLIVSLIFLIIALVFSFSARVETDTMEMMGDEVEFVENSKYITDRLGGIYSFEIFIELPEQGMAKDPVVLQVLDRIAAHTGKWESVNNISSINDIVKDLNMTMNNNDPRFYTIPDKPELVAQYLLLYEMSGGENAEDWVDYDYQRLRLSVQVRDVSSNAEEKFLEIKKMARDTLPAGTEVNIVGDVPILMKMLNMLAFGQIKSIFLALMVITLVMILILKSIRVGLLSMIPNIVPVILVGGAMGLFDFPIDMMTIMIAPMIIGIAVDDTVHYIIHFKQEIETADSYPSANRGTFSRVGRAIFFTSVILCIGFSILGLSVVKSLLHMAVLSGVGIIGALVADLFITPVLFVYLKPFRKITGSK